MRMKVISMIYTIAQWLRCRIRLNLIDLKKVL